MSPSFCRESVIRLHATCTTVLWQKNIFKNLIALAVVKQNMREEPPLLHVMIGIATLSFMVMMRRYPASRERGKGHYLRAPFHHQATSSHNLEQSRQINY